MLFSRSHFAAAAAGAVAAGVIRFPGSAAEFTYKMGNDIPADHPVAAHSIKAAARVLRESGGQMEIQVFPNSALGGQPQMVTQARAGALEFLMIGDNVLASVVPVVAMSGIPFAFPTYKDAWAFADGPCGKYIRNTINNANIGLYTFEHAWDAGFRQMVNGVRPVAAPADLKGLKMRIPQAPMPIAMFKAFGASPTPISAAEMYTALQTHLVDGLDNPLVSLEAFKLYEVQKYVSITNHAWTAYQLHASVGPWEKLPKKLRDIVERAYTEEAIVERNEVSRGDAAFEVQLKSQGMTFNRPNVPSFKAVMQSAGLYGTWRDTFGAEAWGLLEKTTGKLG